MRESKDEGLQLIRSIILVECCKGPAGSLHALRNVDKIVFAAPIVQTEYKQL